MIISTLAEQNYGITANCQYSVHLTNFGPLSRPYLCTVSDQPVRGLVSVENVIGKHESGKTNDDVKVLSVKAIKCSKIPSGFEKYFKNLEGIFAYSSEKTILVNEDLAPFPKLKYLDISLNRITHLPTDVFEDNPLMEWIDISDNRLKLVGLDIFKPLKKLHFANFERNYCIDERARDKSEIERIFIKRLELKCQFGESYTGTTPSPDGRVKSTTPYDVEEEETTKKGFWKKIFG